MGQITVNVGSFDLTSHNGNTAYSTVRYFDIPANAGITGCVATFATHVNTGNFQGKSFSLNGTQAHPNTPWPTSGISLNVALLSTGQNTFRAAVKSQAGLSARWSIGDIYLTITYNDIGGGDPPPPPNIGTITLNKSSMLAGETVTVSLSPCDNGIYRSIRVKWQGTLITSLIVGGDVPSGGTYTYTFPLADCSRMPNDTSGSLTFEMETSVDIMVSRTMIILVPDSVVPTIGTFTATRNANGVDASITNYVQNYSKVALAIGGEAGALGSSIVSYEITGGGKSAATSSASFGPFAQTGDITFTAKVTDTRGRTATRTVTINVLPYTPVSGVNLLAYRSDGSKVADDKGAYATIRGRRVFSSLDGQNAAVIKGRVYEKDTTAPGWTNLTDDTLTLFGGGTLSQEKGYTAEIAINDKITAVVYVFQIPTATVGIHIMPGATGGGFGMYGQPNRWDFHKPVYANDIILTSSPNTNLLHNWDFRNPVNQRGVSGSFSTVGGHFIDRWKLAAVNCSVYSGHITTSAGTFFEHWIEGVGIAGKTLTFSVMLLDGTVHTIPVIPPTTPDTYGTAGQISGFGGASIYRSTTGHMRLQFTTDAGKNIIAVKLELGTVSTLHLDPPADYGTELLKCQRYCLKVDGYVARSIEYYSTGTRFLIPTPVTMRVTPSLASGSLQWYSTSGVQIPVTSMSVNSTNSGVIITFNSTSAGVDGMLIAFNAILSSDL